MRYDAEHKERTRARVLKEAARAIRAEGPHKVGVAEVMKRAGLTHGGFYAHFKSKDDLVAQAMGEMFADARTAYEARTLDRPPREALAAYIGFYLSRTHRDARDSGCPLPALSADLPRLEPAARERFGAGVARLTDRIRALLEAADVPDADALAGPVLSELVGAVALARAVPNIEQSDAILAASRDGLLRRLGLEPFT